MKTATEMAAKLSMISKSTHADILSMWIEEVVDEIQERILNKESAGGDDIIDIIQEVKQQINS